MKYLSYFYHIGMYGLIGVLNYLYYILTDNIVENTLYNNTREAAELMCIWACDLAFAIIESTIMYFLIFRPANYFCNRSKKFKNLYIIVSSISFLLMIFTVWAMNYRIYECIALTAFFMILFVFCITHFNNKCQDFTK